MAGKATSESVLCCPKCAPCCAKQGKLTFLKQLEQAEQDKIDLQRELKALQGGELATAQKVRDMKTCQLAPMSNHSLRRLPPIR